LFDSAKFHRIPRLRPRFCSAIVASSSRDTFYCSRNRSVASPFDFYSSFRDIFMLSFLFFSEFFAAGQMCLHCFSHVPTSFFIAPRDLTNFRKQPVVIDAVVANRSRLRVTNVSDPIDVRLLFFRDRSSLPAVLKFDGNNVYIMIVNDVVKNAFFFSQRCFLRNWCFLCLVCYDISNTSKI
jgi:hypothetical protein